MPGTREREDFVRAYSPDKGWKRWDREEPPPEEYRRERKERRDGSPRRGRSPPRRRRSRSPSPEARRNRWDQHQRQDQRQDQPMRVQQNSSYMDQRNEQRQSQRYRTIWARSPSPPPSYHREKKKWQKLWLQEMRKNEETRHQPVENLIQDEFGRIPKDLPEEGEEDNEQRDQRAASSSTSSREKREDSPSEGLRKRKNDPPRSPETSQRDRKKRKQEESESESSDSDSDSEDEEESSEEEEEDVWVEKEPVIPERAVGPEPATKMATSSAKVDYGGGLMKGEAEAYAQYVQEGKRIPRRGEVGLASNEIEEFEDLGFVMSGSRHKRMNAVRLRKENQVYTAEEKRAMLQLAFEEKAKKENKILADMREIVSQKLQSVDIPVDKPGE